MFRVICVLIGYVLGCLQTAYLVGRVTKNIDIREHGSKNAGTSNTIRVLGRVSGLVVFITDVLKALAAFWLASFIFKDNGLLPGLYAGLGAVLGHNFPVFLKFKGGKGIASSLGVYLAMDWRAALILYAVGLVSVAATKYISLASLLMTLLAPVVFWVFGYGWEEVTVLAVMTVMAWVLHKGNIVRIVTRTERKFTLMKKSAAALLLICFFAFTGCAGNAPDVPALEQPTEAVESAAPAAQETAIPEPAAPEPAAPEPATPDPTAPADAAASAEPAESASAEVQPLAAAVPQIPMSAGTAGDFVTSGGVCETVADIAREGTAWKFSGRSSTWVASLDVTDYVVSGGLYEFTAWAYVDKADATVMHLSLETKSAGGTAAYATFGDYNGEPRQGGVWVPLGGRIRFDANSGNTYTIYLETGHYQQGNKFYGHMPDIWVDDISFMKIENEYDLTLPSLAGVYADKFLMGNILAPAEIGDAVTTEMFKHHYNTVTANNHMKPAHLTSAKGVYDFTQADRLVDWAVENGIAVHGHVLVWHQQSAEWLNGGATAPLTRAEAKENLEAYINEVAKHFAGRVVSWDVVNEAIADSAAPGMAWRNALRKDGGIGEVGGSGGSPWWAAYENGANKDAGESGADYVYDAFVFARLADPDAVLYYNDYNETVAGKRAAIVEMTNELNAQWAADGRNTEPGRLLIEGLGMQGHYFTGHTQDNAVEVEKTIRAFAATGAEVSITELDLPIGRYRGIPANITDELRQQQARIYSEIFDVLSSNSDVITRVTFWGKNDDNSWDGRGAGEPLLFDVNYGKKPAFDAVVD